MEASVRLLGHMGRDLKANLEAESVGHDILCGV